MNWADKKREFYDSKEWRKVRVFVLNRDMYLCQCEQCKQRGIVKAATFVHHIKELRTHWHLRLEPRNLVAYNIDCHNEHDHAMRRGKNSIARYLREFEQAPQSYLANGLAGKSPQ